MLSYFRVNDPYRLIGLLIITVLLFLAILVDAPPLTSFELKTLIIGSKLDDGFHMYSSLIDLSSPFTSWVYKVVSVMFGDSLTARHIIALFIIFFQATYLGIMFIDKKVFPENSFLPSLIFIILYIFSFDSLTLSGDLFALCFLLISINHLLKEIEFREENLTNVLKVGFYIGIASLFSLSFSVYVPAALVILLLFTRSSGKKFSLLFFGFLMPHLLLASLYVIDNKFQVLWQYFYAANLSFSSDNFVNFSDTWPLLIVPGVFCLISLVFLNRESRFTKYQSQLLQAFFFWMIFSLLQVIYAKEFRPQTFITLFPALSFYIAHFLLLIRRRRIAEMACWLFVVATVVFGYYNRYNLDRFAKYVIPSAPTGQDKLKKIVILSDNINGYYGNTLATPFLNWKLSRDMFEHPEYYENITAIYEGIVNDWPEYISDPENKMAAVFARAPGLKRKYQQVDKGYVLLSRKN